MITSYVPGTKNGDFAKPHWGAQPTEDKRTPEQKERDKQLGKALGREWTGPQ